MEGSNSGLEEFSNWVKEFYDMNCFMPDLDEVIDKINKIKESESNVYVINTNELPSSEDALDFMEKLKQDWVELSSKVMNLIIPNNFIKKIEVKFNGVAVGYTYDGGKSIEFFDSKEAKEIMKELNTGSPIGISSRRIGKVDENGYVYDMGDINELNIIKD